MNIISVLTGIFKINGKGSNDIGKVLDAHAECCAGVHCCYQVVILKDHTPGSQQGTGAQYVGYFLNGVWTTKTLADFKANGA